MNSKIGTELWPGWETTRLIGQGSYGTVYEIQRDVLGNLEKAALKVISIPQSHSEIEDMYNDGYDEASVITTLQGHLKNIVSEYALMRKMTGCSNIVNCDDVRYQHHEDGIGWDVFIKMELLTPMAKALSAGISERIVRKLAWDMCTALELCRKHGIVHRDIKPQNIFVSDNGDFKLGDFGIAKTMEKTMSGTKIGTYKYMAPEVFHNHPYGAASDIYSLGLVLYWLLNERRMPFLPLPPEKLSFGQDEQAKDRRLAGEPLPPPAHGSEALKRIVLKACAYDPADRYATAAEMMQDLSAGTAAKPAAPAAAPAVKAPAQNLDATVRVARPTNNHPRPAENISAAAARPIPQQPRPAQRTPAPQVPYQQPPQQQMPPQTQKKNTWWPLLLLVPVAVAVIAIGIKVASRLSEDRPTGSYPESSPILDIGQPTASQVSDPGMKETLFQQNLLPVLSGGKWGYVDATGSFVINSQFDDAYIFDENGLARVSVNDYYGFIDQAGRYVLNPQYDAVYNFAENGLALVLEGDKWGYINETGNYAINPQFDDAWSFNEQGQACVMMGDKCGWINSSGKYIITPQYDDFYNFGDNGLALVMVNDKWGYIDETGRYVINPQFDKAHDFAENGLACVQVGDKRGYIDESGEYVIDLQFDDSANYFSDNGLAWVGISGSGYGFIDETGAYVIEPHLDGTANFAEDGWCRVLDGEKIGYIDATGNYVIEPQFDDAYDFFNNLAPVAINDKWGFIDRTGAFVIEPQFDDITPFYDDGYAMVLVNGKCGVIDRTGAYVIDPLFDEDTINKTSWFN